METFSLSEQRMRPIWPLWAVLFRLGPRGRRQPTTIRRGYLSEVDTPLYIILYNIQKRGILGATWQAKMEVPRLALNIVPSRARMSQQHTPPDWPDKVNRNTWQKPDADLLQGYAVADGLFKPEEAILYELRDSLRGKKLLDIGVGGGRTCRALVAISSDYTALDYSSAMVKACKDRYPNLHVLCCDAGALSVPNETFDFVLFSYNGIDYVSQNGRLLILTEAFRVTKNGGWFAFSSHNRGYENFSKVRSPLPAFIHNPLKMGYRIIRLLWKPKPLVNYLKNRAREIHGEEYSIINERTHDYSLLTYHTTIDRQLAQLRQIGFTRPTRVYGVDGKEVSSDTQDPWLYYLVRK